MRAAFCGSMIPTITSHLVFLLAKPLSQKNQTQCPGIRQQTCPGIILKCPGITQLPSLVMRARAPLENIPSSSWYNSNLSQKPCSRSNDCHPVPRTNVQDSNDVRQKTVSLPPKKKRSRQYRRERRAREREQREERYLIMMRAGPVSTRETHPVPAFQHK